jgi:hypothetical protein
MADPRRQDRVHAGPLTIRGRAPYEIELRWTYAPPIPLGLTAEARQALVDQRPSDAAARVMPR